MTRSIRICRNSTRTSVSISSQSKKSRFQGAFCIRMRLSEKNIYNFTSFVTPQQPPTPQPCTSNPSLKDSSGANSRICRNSTRTSVSISSQSKKSRFQGAFCIRMRLSEKNIYNFTSFVTPQQPPTPQPCTSNPSLKDSSGANSSWPKPELPLSKPFVFLD